MSFVKAIGVLAGVGAVLVLAGCGRKQDELPTVSEVTRVTVLPTGAFAVSEPYRFKPDGSYAESCWGAPIRALNPIRVYDDRVNVAVVTSENAQEERGVYFTRLISSYSPMNEPGRIFHWNEKAGYLEYVITKNEFDPPILPVSPLLR